jgi:feruloyl esterase
VVVALVLSVTGVRAAHRGPRRTDFAQRGGTTCEDLKSLVRANTTIAAATSVAAGGFTRPGAPPLAGAPSPFASLPAFCRVQGVIAPTTDSQIEFEVWLPSSGWNRKYQGTGNGGFAGTLNYANMASAVGEGYAASTTDTGHTGIATDAKWAFGHPEKIVDFGHRAVHETAETSKAIIRAFYGEPAKFAYFSSCSNGGRQALMEAQRYPADYDGIIAGAPAHNFTRLVSAFAWNLLATAVEAASRIPPAKYAAIEAAALSACDARDGVKDGIIDEPSSCAFDPAPLLCTGAESDACLTAPQLAALKKIYSGPRTTRGERLYPGFVPGGESGPGGWGLWVSGPAVDRGLQFLFSVQGNRDMIFQDPSYDYRKFNVDRDVKIADDLVGRHLNATDPDLRAFQKRGGKLILYHGWSDAALPPTATIDYYRAVINKVGQKNADAFVRLYMVPGMQHCGAGPGPDNFGAMPGVAPKEPDPAQNMSAALERWVEHGTAPGPIVATKYKSPDPASGVAMTRPLCPYPEVARYKGTGSADVASSFACMKK